MNNSRSEIFTGQNSLTTATAALVGLIYGYDIGAIAGAILYLSPYFELSTFMVSAVVSSLLLGQIFGALFAGRISNMIGRKRSMILLALGYAVFSAFQGVVPSEWFLIAVRFLLGFFVGLSVVVAPAFIGESAPARSRGSMLVSFQLATMVGISTAYFVGAAFTGPESWRLILSLAALPALIVLFVVIRLPETPRWLVMNGQRDKALEVFRSISPGADPQTEVDLIDDDLSYEEKGNFSELFRGRLRKAGIFVVGLGALVQLSGITAITLYSPTIIQTAGVSSARGAIFITGLIQVAGLVAVILAFFVVDRWGRRPILLTGIGTLVVANAIIAIAFILGPSVILAFLGLLLFNMGFAFGYGSILWVYASESLPARLRTQGGSVLLTSDVLTAFLVGTVFINVFVILGPPITFVTFMGIALFAFFFLYRLAPETKGRRLEEIRTYWYNDARWPEETPTGEKTTTEGS